MFTKITKVVAAVALLVGFFPPFYRSYYFWAVIFLAVACLFNPIRPITLPDSMGLLSEMAAAILFMISLAVLRAKPRLSLASITASRAGSESL
jgi:hypothetical protein